MGEAEVTVDMSSYLTSEIGARVDIEGLAELCVILDSVLHSLVVPVAALQPSIDDSDSACKAWGRLNNLVMAFLRHPEPECCLERRCAASCDLIRVGKER